jgi:hypothetical protein
LELNSSSRSFSSLVLDFFDHDDEDDDEDEDEDNEK